MKRVRFAEYLLSLTQLSNSKVYRRETSCTTSASSSHPIIRVVILAHHRPIWLKYSLLAVAASLPLTSFSSFCSAGMKAIHSVLLSRTINEFPVDIRSSQQSVAKARLRALEKPIRILNLADWTLLLSLMWHSQTHLTKP